MMGRNVPPLASQSSFVTIDPSRPNFAFGPNSSFLRSCGGAQKFTCSCHCAMQRGFESVLVVGEVIVLLRNVGQEDLEAIVDSGLVVLIFFSDFAGGGDDLIGF